MDLAQLQQYFTDYPIQEADLNFNYGGTVSLECRCSDFVEEFELDLGANDMLAYESFLESQSIILRVFHGWYSNSYKYEWL